MKNALTFLMLSFSLLIISSNAQAQNGWWPVHQLIPTQDNSTNLCLNSGCFVWEHQVDSATTAIYYQIIGNEPICLLFTPGVNYTKPFLHSQYPYSIVFFEGNPYGNSDIFLILVDGSGNPITEMQPLSTSAANDHGFQYIENCWPRKFVWLEDETLKLADLVQNDYHFTVSNIVTIDSLNCSSPVVFEYYNSLYWMKNMGFYDVIRFSWQQGDNWTDPINIDTAEQIQALKNTTYNYQLLQWTFKEDTSWFMMDYFPDSYYSSFIVPDVSQNQPFDFDVCDIGVGVKNSDDVGDNFFQAYIDNYNGYDEVFLNQYYDINTYNNFSNMGANCRNPQFFIGEYAAPSTFFFYITWEAFVDSSWQIYYSKTPITWGGIEENDNGLVRNLMVLPNPFQNGFKISFNLEKPLPVTIDLIDIHGRLLTNLLSEKCSAGSFSRLFDVSSMPLFTGPCLIRINVEGSNSFIKAIRVN